MPRQLESYSERYGLFGVTLALIGWLVGVALILVAATAVASEFDRTEAPWARRDPSRPPHRAAQLARPAPCRWSRWSSPSPRRWQLSRTGPATDRSA